MAVSHARSRRGGCWACCRACLPRLQKRARAGFIGKQPSIRALLGEGGGPPVPRPRSNQAPPPMPAAAGPSSLVPPTRRHVRGGTCRHHRATTAVASLSSPAPCLAASPSAAYNNSICTQKLHVHPCFSISKCASATRPSPVAPVFSMQLLPHRLLGTMRDYRGWTALHASAEALAASCFHCRPMAHSQPVAAAL